MEPDDDLDYDGVHEAIPDFDLREDTYDRFKGLISDQVTHDHDLCDYPFSTYASYQLSRRGQ